MSVKIPSGTNLCTKSQKNINLRKRLTSLQDTREFQAAVRTVDLNHCELSEVIIVAGAGLGASSRNLRGA